MKQMWLWFKHRKDRSVCKIMGHARKPVQVIDKAKLLQVDYLGNPLFMVEKQHYVCRRCFSRVDPPNGV